MVGKTAPGTLETRKECAAVTRSPQFRGIYVSSSLCVTSGMVKIRSTSWLLLDKLVGKISHVILDEGGNLR